MTANKKSYPMLSKKVWWQLRKKFKQSIPGTVTTSYLVALLDMKENSARNNVLPYLEQLGIIDNEGKTLHRARQWRDDAQYPDVCKEIREKIYPKDLLDAAPNPSEDKDAASRWFANNTGTGQTAVSKMVGVYSLLMDADVNTESTAHAKTETSNTKKASAPKKSRASETKNVNDPSGKSLRRGDSSVNGPGVYINLQIHVSSDATPDQIDQLFASMAKHIYRKE